MRPSQLSRQRRDNFVIRKHFGEADHVPEGFGGKALSELGSQPVGHRLKEMLPVFGPLTAYHLPEPNAQGMVEPDKLRIHGGGTGAGGGDQAAHLLQKRRGGLGRRKGAIGAAGSGGHDVVSRVLRWKVDSVRPTPLPQLQRTATALADVRAAPGSAGILDMAAPGNLCNKLLHNCLVRPGFGQGAHILQVPVR